MKTLKLPPHSRLAEIIKKQSKPATVKFKVNFEFELTKHDLEGILEEAPIGYWGKFTDSKRTKVQLNGDDTHNGQRVFNVDLVKGMSLLAPSRVQAFYSGDWDGEDEDVLVQLSTLGEVIYG